MGILVDRAIVVLMLGAAQLPYAANAQTAATGTSSALDEIIVTAQRRSENLQKTPVSIAALNPEALKQRAVLSEADLQFAVPGLNVRHTLDSNDFSFAMRGQTYEHATGSQAAVQPYFNEVPVTANAPASFYDLQSIQVLKGPQGTLFGKNVTGGTVLLTSTRPTDRLEGYVQGGIGNYAYRNLQAALNVPVSEDVLMRVAGNWENRDGFTRNLFSGRRLGKVDRKSLRGTLLVRPSTSLTNTLTVEYSWSGGSGTPLTLYSINQPGSTNNGFVLNSAITSLYSPALDAITGVPGAWAAYVASHPGVDPDGLAAYFAKQQNRSPFRISSDFPNSNHASAILISNVTAWDVADGVQIKNIFGYGRTKARQNFDLDGSPFEIESSRSNRKNRQYSDELQVLGKALDDRLSYVAGIYYAKSSRYDFTDVSFLDLGPIIPVTRVIYKSVLHDRNLSGYAQGTYDLSDMTGLQGLGITVGARYTSEKVTLKHLPGSAIHNIPGLSNSLSSKVNKLSWQIGLQEQLNPETLLYVVTRRSFRTGGFNYFSPPRPGTAAVGGAEFKPEIATDVEAGVKFQDRIGDVPTRLNVAVYKQWVKDIQRTLNVVVPNVGVSALTTNVPEAQVFGVEGALDLNPASWLDVGGTIVYTDAKFSKNAVVIFGQQTNYGPYPDSPRWSGSAYVRVASKLPNSDVTASLRAEVYAQTGSYFSALGNTIIPGTRLPGYTLVNLRLAFDDVLTPGLTIAGYMKNALDKRYFAGGVPIGSALSINTALPGSPRTFYLEASLKF